MASPPKYSVVMPVRNGADTLRVSLPYMLKAIDRDDVEWVMSDNHSTDSTADFLHSLDDPRVKIVRPEKPLFIGDSLDFAYSQATGEWQGHLGDDDQLIPNRFDIADKLIADTAPDVVRGEWIRYQWPEHTRNERGNVADPCAFTGRVQVRSGRQAAIDLLAARIMPGGGSWLVRNHIVNAVRERVGRFAPNEHMEFFCMRASAAMAGRVAYLNLPWWIIGRHIKSAGEQDRHKRRRGEKLTFDWKKEQPNKWAYSPYNFHGYLVISLDAAMAVADKFAPELDGAKVDIKPWLPDMLAELFSLYRKGREPFGALAEAGLATFRMPAETRNYVLHALAAKIARKIGLAAPVHDTKPSPATQVFGWDEALDCATIGVHNINELADWIAKVDGLALMSSRHGSVGCGNVV